MSELSRRPRYYTRTVRYHVWAVMRRHESNRDPEARPNMDLDEVVEWVGARQHRGDANAREYARATCERLNREADTPLLDSQLSLTDQGGLTNA